MRNFIILFGFLLFACSNNKPSEKPLEKEPELKPDLKETVEPITKKTTPKDTISDLTFDLGTESIVFITPDSVELAKLKIEHGDDFYTIADDQNFYFSEAINFIESRSMSYEVTKKRYVKLKVNHNWNHTANPVKDLLIDTDTIEYKWFVIMHDGYDPPIISAYVDVPEDFMELDE